MLYFEKTSDMTQSWSYNSPKQYFDNIEDFKVTEATEVTTLNTIKALKQMYL